MLKELRGRAFGVIDLKKFIVLCAAYSVFVLILSYTNEILFDVQACNLCKVQRIPLLAIFLTSLVGIFTPLKKIAINMISLFFFTSLTLSLYHLAIQSGIVSDPCVIPKGIENLDQFKKMLIAKIPCSKISWSILGIPISAYNSAFSFWFLTIIKSEDTGLISCP